MFFVQKNPLIDEKECCKSDFNNIYSVTEKVTTQMSFTDIFVPSMPTDTGWKCQDEQLVFIDSLAE